MLSNNSKFDSEYLTRPQAAKYLNLKKSTLDAWATRGGGPPIRKFGNRAVRYYRPELDEWASEKIIANTSQA